jgi:hypothetical protein
MVLYRTAPPDAARMRRVAPPYRRLRVGVQRWVLRLLPRRSRAHGGRESAAASRRAARWLRLLVGVMVMAALFTVLMSAADPSRVEAGIAALR